MRLKYNVAELGQDLREMGTITNEQDRRVLMVLLDGSLEGWIDHLQKTTDLLISILPHRTTRRTTEVVCVIGGNAVKIENQRTCAWKDYNGDHYFTENLLIHANSNETIRQLLADFKAFMKISGINQLKERTKEILPAWSVAFVHRMPQSVQSFYFPGV